MRLTSFPDFLRLLHARETTLVALDVRGTLLKAPRGGHLTRAFAGAGLSGPVLEAMDTQVPRRVLDRYPAATTVVDWTLVTVLEAGRLAQELGATIDSAALEAAFQIMNTEYRTRSLPLVDDAQLLRMAQALQRSDVDVILSADGPAQRERDVIRTLFPRTHEWGLDVFSSETAGTNKLSSAYFSRLAGVQGLDPARIVVVGDRLDKDVRPALAAGCGAVLIGVTEQDVPQAERFAHICPPDTTRLRTALVLGRFQPLHHEHVRYLEAALERADHVVVGVTHPFESVAEVGVSRNLEGSNPLPYWLRERLIRSWAEQARVADRISVRPVPLSAEGLRATMPTTVPVLVTEVEPWSYEKRALIESAGYSVMVLPVGEKSISATEIRERIRAGDSSWRGLVPSVDSELLDQVVDFVS